MTMIEEETRLSEMDHFDCSVCMDLLHLPHQIDPCRHTFCQSCLIRLSQARRSNCPMCRGAINGTKLNLKLHLALWTQHFDDYENRNTVELESGIYDIPMNWIFQFDYEELLQAALRNHELASRAVAELEAILEASRALLRAYLTLFIIILISYYIYI